MELGECVDGSPGISVGVFIYIWSTSWWAIISNPTLPTPILEKPTSPQVLETQTYQGSGFTVQGSRVSRV